MNVEKIDVECLPKIENAVKVNLDKYLNSNDYWLGDFINELGYTTQYSNVDIDDPRFVMTGNDLAKQDLENAKRIYMSWELAPELAGNGAFWTLVSHHFAEYVKYRCGINGESKDPVKDIKDNFIFQNILDMRTRRKGLLPRLWTLADLTFDGNNTGDEFWITREALTDQDIVYNLVDRRIFNNKDVVKAFLEYHAKRREGGKPMSRGECRDLYKFFFALSQTVVLESFQREDFHKSIVDFEGWYSRKKRNTVD